MTTYTITDFMNVFVDYGAYLYKRNHIIFIYLETRANAF